MLPLIKTNHRRDIKAKTVTNLPYFLFLFVFQAISPAPITKKEVKRNYKKDKISDFLSSGLNDSVINVFVLDGRLNILLKTNTPFQRASCSESIENVLLANKSMQ